MLKKALLVLGIAAALFLSVKTSAVQAEPKFGLLGTPYSVNGDLSYDIYKHNRGGEGVHFSTSVQQGLEVARFGPQDRFHLIPFVELRLKIGQNPDVYPWNNKVEESLGVKVRYDVPLSGSHAGVVDVGIRALHNDYIGSTNHGRGVDIGGQAFVTFWFGGDWMKK